MINLYRYKDLLADSNNQKKTSMMHAIIDDPEDKDKEGAKKVKVLGDTDAFTKFRSCAIDEIKLKVFSEPEKHKETSVFMASREQIERAK